MSAKFCAGFDAYLPVGNELLQKADRCSIDDSLCFLELCKQISPGGLLRVFGLENAQACTEGHVDPFAIERDNREVVAQNVDYPLVCADGATAEKVGRNV